MMTNPKLKLAHILLVEDNEGDILLTKEAFDESKVKVDLSVVKNGKDALDFLYQRGEFKEAIKPELVLLDINLPIFNGHEVLKQIKSDPKLKSIPVIVLTTSSNQKDIDQAYMNHCNSYIKKPINLNDFLSAILKIEEFWLHITTLAK